MTTNANEFNENAYKMAWDWFRVHADQRMDLFRFYVAISAAIAAGYGGAIQIQRPSIAMAVAIIGVVIGPVFLLLDYRVSSLLKLGEQALKKEQAKLRRIVQYKEIEIAEGADCLAKKQASFSQLFRFVFLSFTVLFLGGALYAYGNLSAT